MGEIYQAIAIKSVHNGISCKVPRTHILHEKVFRLGLILPHQRLLYIVVSDQITWEPNLPIINRPVLLRYPSRKSNRKKEKKFNAPFYKYLKSIPKTKIQKNIKRRHMFSRTLCKIIMIEL